MNTHNIVLRFTLAGLTILSCACSTPHRSATFHSGERQAMKITVGVVSQTSDVEIPLATIKNGSQEGGTYGQAAGEGVASLAGFSVPAGIAIVLIGSTVGKLAGVISDATEKTVSGQAIEVLPSQGGTPIRVLQPNQTKKLKPGDRVRIVEGSFFTHLEPASD